MAKIILFRNNFIFSLADVPGEDVDELKGIVSKWFDTWFELMAEKARKEDHELLFDSHEDNGIGGPCYYVETDTHEDFAAAHDWVAQNLDFWRWFN